MEREDFKVTVIPQVSAKEARRLQRQALYSIRRSRALAVREASGISTKKHQPMNVKEALGNKN